MINEQHYHPTTDDRRPTTDDRQLTTDGQREHGKRWSVVGGQWSVCTPDSAGHCITCSDEAIEAVVIDIDREMLLASVSVDEATAEVDVSLVEELAIGDHVLVHGGVAIAKL